MNRATDRQLEIHAFMLTHQREHCAPPTLREIADRFGFSSVTAARDHLFALAKKGLVRHREHVSRGWIAVEQSP